MNRHLPSILSSLDDNDYWLNLLFTAWLLRFNFGTTVMHEKSTFQIFFWLYVFYYIISLDVVNAYQKLLMAELSRRNVYRVVINPFQAHYQVQGHGATNGM
jgi:hypothetical protein